MSYKFEKLSVLIVEDTTPMRKLVTSVLDTLGIGRIVTAQDGESGYKRFCDENPDIVITDWHMEPVNGIELIEMIRNRADSPNRMVPIIVMSGYSALTRVSKARDMGTTEFLVKPFSANDLARRIAYVISKPRDFIDANNYFGPDRRRRKIENYNGSKRRLEDKIG